MENDQNNQNGMSDIDSLLNKGEEFYTDNLKQPVQNLAGANSLYQTSPYNPNTTGSYNTQSSYPNTPYGGGYNSNMPYNGGYNQNPYNGGNNPNTTYNGGYNPNMPYNGGYNPNMPYNGGSNQIQRNMSANNGNGQNPVTPSNGGGGVRCPRCGSTSLQAISDTHGEGVKLWKICLCGFLGLCGAGKTTTEHFWVCNNCGNRFKM